MLLTVGAAGRARADLAVSSTAEIESRRSAFLADVRRYDHGASVAGDWANGGLVAASIGGIVIIGAEADAFSHDNFSQGDWDALQAGAWLFLGGLGVAAVAFTVDLLYQASSSHAAAQARRMNEEGEAAWYRLSTAQAATVSATATADSAVAAGYRDARWRRLSGDMETVDAAKVWWMAGSGAGLTVAFYGYLFSEPSLDRTDAQLQRARTVMWSGLGIAALGAVCYFVDDAKYDRLREERNGLRLAPAPVSLWRDGPAVPGMVLSLTF